MERNRNMNIIDSEDSELLEIAFVRINKHSLDNVISSEEFDSKFGVTQSDFDDTEDVEFE